MRKWLSGFVLLCAFVAQLSTQVFTISEEELQALFREQQNIAVQTEILQQSLQTLRVENENYKRLHSEQTEQLLTVTTQLEKSRKANARYKIFCGVLGGAVVTLAILQMTR